MEREHQARLTYFRGLLSALAVVSRTVLPVDVHHPFHPITVYVDDVAHWPVPPSSSATAIEPRAASLHLGPSADGGTTTDDGSCDSDSTEGPPPLVDASDTSSDDDSDDSSDWGSLFLEYTDLSPDGPGLCGQPFGHSSCRPSALIDVDVRPARRGGTLTHGMRHTADTLLQKTATTTAHTFLNVKGTTLAGGGSGINPNWILLDSQSTCNVFSNPRLLRCIQRVPHHITIHSQAGQSRANLVGHRPDHGWVWYQPGGSAASTQ